MTTTLILLAALAAAPAPTGSMSLGEAMTGDLGPLHTWIAADGGVPVDLDDDTTIVLFGDTWTGENDGETMPERRRFVHSSALLIEDGTITPMLDLLPGTVDDTFYWIADARPEPDGSLTVVASEVRATGEGFWAFEGVDTDMFRVSDPTNVMSWRLAEKIDAGWWDGHDVHFVDGDPCLAAVEPFAGGGSWLYDSCTDTAEPINGPESAGLFVPVEHDGEWWAASWVLGITAVWSAPTATGPWTWRHGIEHDGITYLSQIHVLDGELTLQWSNARSDTADDALTSNRPTYLTLENLP